jgi:hypothetical protein
LLLIATVVLLAAIAGKGVACWLAARFNGESNRTALAIGTLMNARGLMEVDYHQHRSAEGYHPTSIIFDHGRDGNCNHSNGITGIQTSISEKASRGHRPGRSCSQCLEQSDSVNALSQADCITSAKTCAPSPKGVSH